MGVSERKRLPSNKGPSVKGVKTVGVKKLGGKAAGKRPRRKTGTWPRAGTGGRGSGSETAKGVSRGTLGAKGRARLKKSQPHCQIFYKILKKGV